MSAMQSMEEAWGALVLAAARAEGHGPTVWRPNSSGEIRPGRRNGMRAGETTIQMVRLIAQGPHSTRQLSEATGMTVDEASWRLRHLMKHGWIECVGMGDARQGKRASAIYKATAATAHWLSVYEQEDDE